MAAETVGTVSAVLTLAEASVVASRKLYELFTTIRDAPQEITSISRDIKNFNALVENLKHGLVGEDVGRVVDGDPTLRRALDDLSDPMESCHQACLQIQDKVERHYRFESSVGQSSKGNSKSQYLKHRKSGSIAWYFRRGEVFALISRFQLTKGLFSDAMGTLTLLLTFRTSIIMSKEPIAPGTSANENFNDRPQASTNSRLGRKHRFNDDAGSAFIEYTERLSVIAPSGPVAPPQHTRDKPSDPRYAKEFLDAVRRGSEITVEMILSYVDIDTRDPHTGRTALSFAAENGNTAITRLLLVQGATVNLRQYSLSNHRTGTNINEQVPMTSGRFPIHWAIVGKHNVIVDLLLQYGANPNSRNTAGRSALQEACMENDPKTARLLLQNGADVNARSYNHGWAPLHEAVKVDLKVLQILLEYEPLLDLPAAYDPCAPGATPVHMATRDGRLGPLRLLLSSGADPDAVMFEDMTALHLAAASGWIDGINVLVDADASINSRDTCTRETPLHKAARNLELEAIKILCERGADTNLRNVDGQTYQDLLECALQYPSDWHVDPALGSYCTFY